MKNFYLALAVLVSFNVRATHILGGEMFYNYTGSNIYEFNLILYRDCGSTVAFDPTIHFTVFNQANTMLQNVSAPFPGAAEVFSVPFSANYSLPCVLNTIDTCVEYCIYKAEIILPPIVGGYNVSYQRCCLVADAQNIENSWSKGFTMTCHIPGSETSASSNSSPRFQNHSPFVVCDQTSITFDHAGFDPDSDSLVYFVNEALSGANNILPNPTTALSPPYNTLSWYPAFTNEFPLGVNSTFILDSLTGELNIYAENFGYYILSINIHEYRNGVLLSNTIRNLVFESVHSYLISVAENTIEPIIFPNPSNGSFYISTQAEIESVEIFDISGKLIYLQTDLTNLNLDSAPVGIYFVVITTNDSVTTHKIQKQ